MFNYFIFSNLIVNILRVLLIGKVMELFLPSVDTSGRGRRAALFFYYLLTAALYCFEGGGSAVYEAGNYLGIAALTFFYAGTWKKRLWVSLMAFVLDASCSLAVSLFVAESAAAVGSGVSTLLLLICVTAISRISYPADDGVDFGRRQTGILLLIPAVSIFMLCVLMLGRKEGTAAPLLCAAVLLINLSVFYLYHLLAENYRNARENDLYRQQTDAYQNQLEVIVESRNRIRALRHDMKNHMLALQILLQKKDLEGAEAYLSSMQDFMANPEEYINTGNDAVDSLLNYKLQRAKELLRTVEARVSIPGDLRLRSFDLNVVLGNLLDNAVEAAAQTEEKRLAAAIRLDRGILSIHIRNSCSGVEEGKKRRLETTKADASAHGIGLKNVRRIVEKYHGDMELTCEGGEMEADVILYIREL